ncbi:hypothetical protein MAR_011442, partial [Mya arenaria]
IEGQDGRNLVGAEVKRPPPPKPQDDPGLNQRLSDAVSDMLATRPPGQLTVHADAIMRVDDEVG